MHLNWEVGTSGVEYAYFDAGEVCCTNDRRFENSGGINVWKQYSFVRGSNYKTVRRSGTATALNSTSAPSSSRTGGAFFIGSADGRDTETGHHHGYMTELIMFPEDFTVARLAPVESNQIRFWGL